MILKLLTQTFSNWQKDNAQTWSAALAYYTVFSLAPLLLIAVSIAGFVFGSNEAMMQKVSEQITNLLGNQGGQLIHSMLSQTSNNATSIVGTIIGFVTLLLGASGVFGQLKQALNNVWNVEEKKNVGLINTIRNKFLSFSMVLVIGFLLLVSLLASSAINLMSTFFGTLLPFPAIFIESVNFLLSFILGTLLFALMFKYLPDIVLPFRYALIGGTVTSLLFTIGKTLIGLYIGNSSFSSTFGAAASLAVLLIWVYYAVNILLLGAEFTKVYALKTRGVVVPNKFAVVEKEIDYEQQTEQFAKRLEPFTTFMGFFITTFLIDIFTKKSKRYR